VRSCTCYVPVRDQRARAAAYRKGITQLAALPSVVGAHYYSFVDHAALNWGILSAELTPYEELSAAARTTAPNLGPVHASGDTKSRAEAPRQ
jgi:hypothetical protein